MLQWTWTLWERALRSASKWRHRWTLSPLSSFPIIHSWYACRWTKLPSPSGIVTPLYIKIIQYSLGFYCWIILYKNLFSIFDVLLSVNTWPSMRACRQERALCRIRAGSSSSPALNSLFTRRTQTCARRFSTPAGRRDIMNYPGANIITQRGFNTFRDSYHTSASCS